MKTTHPLLSSLFVCLAIFLGGTPTLAKSCGDTSFQRVEVDRQSKANDLFGGQPKFPLTNGKTVKLPFIRQTDVLENIPETIYVCMQAPYDRHGNLVSDAYRNEEEGSSLQIEFVAAGKALVGWPPVTHIDEVGESLIRKLLASEQKARSAKKGIWSTSKATVFDAKDEALTGRYGQFSIVEGRVHQVSEFGKRIFINFDKQWQKDFTVIVYTSDAPNFERYHGPVQNLALKKIRVRGWVNLNNGPEIEIDHPLQVEVLSQ